MLLAGASWRVFGSERAAAALLDAFSSGDEQRRMLAGISLVKAGQRSFDLICDRIEAGQATAELVRLLADIGGEESRGVLESLVREEEGEIASAASESIALLDRVKAL